MDFNHDETEFSYENYEKQIKEFTHIYEDDERLIAIRKKKEAEIKKQKELKKAGKNETNDDILSSSQQISEKMKKIPKPTISIAPDGYIPNSIIMRVIHEWRNKHPEFIVENFNIMSLNSEYDLIREFDKKINDINNIKNENELIKEIIEKYHKLQNQKKLEEMEKVKQNNIKLHTEFSSFLIPQSSFQQNRFLNKYFNGVMPTFQDDEDEMKKKEEEEEEAKKKEEEEAKKKEEEAKKAKNNITNNLNIKNMTRNNTQMEINKNMTRTNTIMSSTDSNNKFLAIKYLNDDIDIKDQTKKNSAIGIIDENIENSSDEGEDYSSNEEDIDDDGEDGNMENDDNNTDDDDIKINYYENQNNNSNENENENSEQLNENKEKPYLYYNENDIPEEIQKLLESFWFPKVLVCKYIKFKFIYIYIFINILLYMIYNIIKDF